MSRAKTCKSLSIITGIMMLVSCRIFSTEYDEHGSYWVTSDGGPIIAGFRSLSDIKIARVLKLIEKHVLSADNPQDIAPYYITLVEAASDGACVNTKTDTDLSPLLASIFGGNVGLVKFFLNKGADMQLATREGLTPLMITLGFYCAARSKLLGLSEEKAENYYKILKSLTKKGATLNLDDAEVENQYLSVLANKGQAELVELVRTRSPFSCKTLNALLFLTVRMSFSQGLSSLISFCGLNVNMQDNNGDTPLHLAVRYNNQKMVQALLEKKADVYTIENNDGLTVHDVAEIFSSNLIALLEGKEEPSAELSPGTN